MSRHSLGFAILCGAALLPAAAGAAPPTQYWMSIETQNQSLPGMGDMLGRMAGIPSGPQRNLLLQLDAPRALPADPQATHDVPPGLGMGPTLPLLPPTQARAAPGVPGLPGQAERPKARMLLYWGCGATVRAGQPRVIDTAQMSPTALGKTLAGRSGSRAFAPGARAGWAHAEWPNEQHRRDVPASGSLQGEHFVHGNYMPDIRFTLGAQQDFMAPVEFTALQGGLGDSIRVQWRGIPTAIGYFAQAMGSTTGGDMVIWNSSEVPDTGFGLLDYLPSEDVRRFIREKAVLAPTTTECAIPQGIFKDAQGAMLRLVAYGEDLHLAQPPRPKSPLWTAHVRLKSTGMAMLGMDSAAADASTDEARPTPPRDGAEPDNPVKSLRRIFGF
ncbi:MAG: hypothetical protein ACOY5C_01725 [Pseudomonadota bacterium]|uniref:hypothetical protein n=1 Tax=Thermithiobacillus tepidarius TaxID=929 RepID=UPI0004031D10|nr:hypothetical protein [Thermithiobacillus tepidarius]